jgi:hypothetical protein
MAFTTRTLRDTVVNAAGAGGTVTVKVDIEDDTTANNAILDASALSGHADGAKLDISRLWWALTQGSADDDTGHIELQEVSSGTDIVQIRLAGTGHYDGSAGLIAGTAANTTVTSGDHEITTFGTSGFVIIEFKKDSAWTA